MPTMRLAYDSTKVEAIPSDAVMVFGYNDGRPNNIAAMRAAFPHAIVVEITVDPALPGDVLDIENGDALPAQAPAWALMMRRLGRVPTCYVALGTWGAVLAAFTAAGVAQPLYGVAHFDNVQELIPGAIYKQYGGVLNQYDLNAVADYWPGIDPPPTEVTDVTQAELMQGLALFFSSSPTPGVPHSGEGYGRIEQAVQAKLNPELAQIDSDVVKGQKAAGA